MENKTTVGAAAELSENPMLAFLRLHGRARAHLKFKALLDLLTEAENVRPLSREEELAREMRVRSFVSNFRSLMWNVDRITDENLRAEISNAIAQTLETTYTLGFYGPKNPIDEQNLKMRGRENTRLARNAKNVAAPSARLEVVSKIVIPLWRKKPRLNGNADGSAKAIFDAVALELKTKGLRKISLRTLRRDLEKLDGWCPRPTK